MKKLILIMALCALSLVPAALGGEGKASDALRKKAAASIEKAEYVIFNTVDANGFPQTRAMANLHQGNKFPAYKDGAFVIYLVTKEGSNKIKQLRANPHAAAYYLDAKSVTSALLTGEATEVKDAAEKKTVWTDWMKGVYGSVDNPDFVVIKLTPTKVKVDIKAQPEEGEL